MSRRALITGATGFIGSRLLRHLQQAGWAVAVLGRPNSVGSVPLRSDDRSFPYTGETAQVLQAVETFRPDVVFHLASLFLATHTSEQIAPLIAANLLFGTQLLEAMQKSGCTVLVNAGTSWQTYTPEPPYDAPSYVPVNLYAATKQAFEDIAFYFVQTAGLRCITLRLFDSYGPGDTRRKILRLLLDALKNGEPIGMSPGDQIMDLVHVDDVCAAFLHAAELALDSAPTAKVYAITGNQRCTLQQIVAILQEAANQRLLVEFGKRPHRHREVMHPWEGPILPGWAPQISLLEGFRMVLTEEAQASSQIDTSTTSPTK